MEITPGYLEQLVKTWGDDPQADKYILISIISRVCTNGDASAAEALLLNWRKKTKWKTAQITMGKDLNGLSLKEKLRM